MAYETWHGLWVVEAQESTLARFEMQNSDGNRFRCQT
jgi:hypothetical protein